LASAYSVIVQIAPAVLLIPVMAMTGKRLAQGMADEYIAPVFNAIAAKERVGMLINSLTRSVHLPVNHINIIGSTGSDDDKS
jgi:hypothetical protein